LSVWSSPDPPRTAGTGGREPEAPLERARRPTGTFATRVARGQRGTGGFFLFFAGAETATPPHDLHARRCSYTGGMSRVIAANEYRRERWRNGLGWTREIHAHRSDPAGDWTWRLSIAEIERDGPFSAFPGVDRALVLLRGNGMRLRFGD